MENKRKILMCDNDEATLQQLSTALQKEGFEITAFSDAAELISTTERFRPSVVIVNPDMPRFNAYDVCKRLQKELKVPRVLLVDPHSTTRAQVDECNPDDVVTKPVEINNLVNLLDKHITVTANTNTDR
ncbi:MAG: response regulator [Flavisolibacter sp.]|nr:response regulator [Flavisolibacter sp.]